MNITKCTNATYVRKWDICCKSTKISNGKWVMKYAILWQIVWDPDLNMVQNAWWRSNRKNWLRNAPVRKIPVPVHMYEFIWMHDAVIKLASIQMKLRNIEPPVAHCPLSCYYNMTSMTYTLYCACNWFYVAC